MSSPPSKEKAADPRPRSTRSAKEAVSITTTIPKDKGTLRWIIKEDLEELESYVCKGLKLRGGVTFFDGNFYYIDFRFFGPQKVLLQCGPAKSVQM